MGADILYMSCGITNDTDVGINKEVVAIDPAVLTLINQKEEYKKQMTDAENTIRNSKEKIKNIDRLLFKQCKHKWQYDFNCAFDDHTKHFCMTCGVWKNQYWYT